MKRSTRMFWSKRPDILYTDLHCHILPGIDDGAADMEMALRMARLARKSGARRMFATPHVLPGLYSPTISDIRGNLEALKILLDAEGIDIALYEGSEISLSEKVEDDIKNRKVLPLGGSDYYLIELPMMSGKSESLDRVFDLLVMGIGVILAHPERIAVVRENRDVVKRMAESGVYLQVNAGSFLGVYGPRAARFATSLMKEDLVHFIGSDAHSGRSSDLRYMGPDVIPGVMKVLRSQTEQERFFSEVEERVDALLSGELR